MNIKEKEFKKLAKKYFLLGKNDCWESTFQQELGLDINKLK